MRSTLTPVLKICPVVLVVTAFNFAFFGMIFKEYPKISNENHIIEYTQVAFLLIGFLIFSYVSMKSVDKSKVIIFLGAALLYINFTIREIEIEKSDLWLSIIINPPIRNYWLVVLWTIIITLSSFYARRIYFTVLNKVNKKSIYYILFGGLFYLFGDIFDKNLIQIDRTTNFFIEETFELSATFFMLMSAIYSFIGEKSRKTSTESASISI
ncbi:MAG: hypothetical protein WD470_04160 [Rhodospirillaceae bacterium]